ncbi:MATE family efflux transporter [Methanobrevibacter sp. DSM 116169]|uniref:MATE family efflux transporter n=1 Tax=Methanobrevibacter sp. DSM 116169 TaxID=3242727 RepID=UPI0038FC6CAD
MNKLEQKISTNNLIRFAIPTIISIVFTNIYSSIDGIFVARFIGTDALSSVNIVWPLLSILIGVGFMFGMGGTALIAKKLGENNAQEAKENFSLITLTAFITSIILSIALFTYRSDLLLFFGANNHLFGLCMEYMQPLLIMLPFIVTGFMFQEFFIAVGKPKIGMGLSILGGITNIILDYYLIYTLNMGMNGAAIATGIAFSVPSIMGLLYFTFNRRNSLYFVRPKFDSHAIIKSMTNGSSEMVTVLSTSLLVIVMNNILIRLAGSDGIAAVTIIIYMQGILIGIFLGYSSGIAPIISYNYGKKDEYKLKKIFSISLTIISIIAIGSLLIGLFFSNTLVGIFVDPHTNVFKMASFGFKIAAFAYLFMGFNIFTSVLFTAFNNGKISAILSFLRTFLFLLILLLILPGIFGVNGVWYAMPLAELCAIMVTIYTLNKFKTNYKYA